MPLFSDGLPPQVWMPPKPAIIRPVTLDLLRYGSDLILAILPGTAPGIPADRGPAVTIDRTTGTVFADATQPGGVANASAAFDGNTNQTFFVGANCNNAVDVKMWVGKQMAQATALYRVTIYGSTDQGFGYTTSPSITLRAFGKNGSQPSTWNDGTALGSVTFTDTANESGGRSFLSTDTLTYWDYLNFVVDKPATNSLIGLTEIVIEGWEI